MRKGTIINFRNLNNIIRFFIQNSWLLGLLIFFIVGLSFGVFSFERFNFAESYAVSYIEDFLSSRANSGFFSIATDSLFHALFFMVLCFVSGASMFGVVMSPLCISLNGWLYGCISAFLYSEYSLKGVAFHAVILLPAAVILTVALVLASRESLKFSLCLARLTFPSTPPANMYCDFKNYCGRYLLLCLLVLFSALVDALISVNFLDSFKLS